MLKRIELTNFMSHAHTIIEPAPGLTVLVGPNNCGKSAVVAALQILCHNEKSEYAVRHGERECSVELQTDDGHSIRWARKKSASYCIDGQTFDRLGRETPDGLHRVLRLPKVDAGDSVTFDIHFGCQKSPIFLLDEPPSAAAKFFGASSDASRLLEIQRRHREKLADKQRERTRLEAESKQLNAELNCLQPAGVIDSRLNLAEQVHQQLAQLSVAILEAERDRASLEGQVTAVACHRAGCKVLAALRSPPALEPETPLETSIEVLERAINERALAERRKESLAGLEQPPQLQDVRPLEQWINQTSELAHTVSRTESERAALSPLSSPPALHATDALDSFFKRLVETHQVVSVEQQRGAALGPVATPPALYDVADLDGLIDKLTTAENETSVAAARAGIVRQLTLFESPADTAVLDELVKEFETIQNRADSLQAEVADSLRQIADVSAQLRDLARDSTCPTCGAPLDADRLLAMSGGGHAHE